MKYQRTNWIDDVTPLSAEKLNNIEQGLVDIGNYVAIPPNNVTGMTATVGKAAIGLKWTDPSDTALGDNTIVRWAGTRIVRKTGSYPLNENDGVVAVDSKVRNQYQNVFFEDLGLTNGTIYYYAAFPYSDYGTVNRNLPTGSKASATPVAQLTIPFNASGSYVIPPGVTSIDAFLVGGGSGGSNASTDNYKYRGGGGGGYTKTYKSAATGWKDGGAITVACNMSCVVTVGAGGTGGAVSSGSSGMSSGNPGGASTLGVNSNTYTANGGSGFNGTFGGGNGGSGGGSGGGSTSGYAGGSGGSDGGSGSTGTGASYSGGSGQGHTTREWGEATGTLYAGGGGGGGNNASSVGGSGGGNGSSGNTVAGGAGGANTGGGGGAGGAYGYPGGSGGSGKVIIRWGY